MVIPVITEEHIKRQSHQKQEENKSKINTDKEKNISHGFIRAVLQKQPFRIEIIILQI
jgi:hypothetical protein